MAIYCLAGLASSGSDRADERVVTDAFSLSGITIFSSYQPDVAIVDSSGDPISDLGSCSDKKFIADTENFCAKTGNSRIFVVNTTNGYGLLQDVLGRIRAIERFPLWFPSPILSRDRTPMRLPARETVPSSGS